MRNQIIANWRWRAVAHSSWYLLVVSALVALAWSLLSTARANTLQGTAAYGEKISLPANAVFDVALQGISQADTPATRRSQMESTDAGIGILPASFTGELPGAGGAIAWQVDLLSEGRYQLRKTYLDKPEPSRFDDIGRWSRDRSGRIVLRGGREAPFFLMPIEDGAALRKLDLHGNPIESLHNDRLTRLPESRPIEPRLLLNGMFTYMADAANITLCADGQRLPVAMEGDYRALEAAYQKANSQPGKPLMVSLEGLITQRPSMEENHPPQTTLVVERFIAVWPGESCGNTLATTLLHGTYWKLVRLGDIQVAAATKQREAHLVFASDKGRVTGNG